MRTLMAALLMAAALLAVSPMSAQAGDTACRNPARHVSKPPKIHYRTTGYGRF